MEALGINFSYLLLQSIIPIVLIGLPVLSLIDLAKKKLSGTPLTLLVLVICAVPFLASHAYWIVKPTAESRV